MRGKWTVAGDSQPGNRNDPIIMGDASDPAPLLVHPTAVDSILGRKLEIELIIKSNRQRVSPFACIIAVIAALA